MRVRRSTNLLVEPPSSATGDIAFNLIVFFLVCASIQPDSGRKQSIPRSEKNEQTKPEDNIRVKLTRSHVFLNGDPLGLPQLEGRLRQLFETKVRPQDRVVIVESGQATPYHHWIRVTEKIEKAGGTITIQREESEEVVVD